MALKYVVKKRVFGFDKTKTEKYVAQNVITNTVNFRDLCKEVSMFGMIPEGAVKHVIDALIDTLNTNLNKGLSVQLGDFGCFRPGMNCKSQNEEKDVDADTVRRVKIVFTPGYKFKAPTATTSSTRSTRLVSSLEMWTRPSLPGAISTKAPKFIRRVTLPL